MARLPGLAARLAVAMWVCIGWSTLAWGDWKDDIGYTRLVHALGDNTPNGAGVLLSQVEAPSTGGAYFPNTTFTDFGADTDPLATAVNFIDGSGGQSAGISNHASNQALSIYGNGASIAPAANQVTIFEANDYLNNVLHAPTGGDPEAQNFRVQSHAWVGSLNESFDVSALQRFDYVIDTYEMTAVVGLGNTSSPLPNLLSQSFNAIAVGRSDGVHSTGDTTLMQYHPGRTKPDLVVPRATTSAATSSTSSAAALLHEVVAGTDAANSETMKAILLAGATKDEFTSWSRTTAKPLDATYGAGELNVYNSYLMTLGGQSAGSISTPTTPVGAYGWDYRTVKPIADVQYQFEIPDGSTAQELSILLAWNYDITDIRSSPNIFSPIGSLANLDLQLLDSTGALVDQSTSTVDNVEHIYLTDLAAGTYTLKVSTDATRDFGLAWRTSTLFDTPSADFNEDGDVDGADFLTWQRGFGTLLGATHADGDADGDGEVGTSDLAILSAAFGTNAAPSGLTAAVPEPATRALACAGLLLFLLWQNRLARRRRHVPT